MNRLRGRIRATGMGAGGWELGGLGPETRDRFGERFRWLHCVVVFAPVSCGGRGTGVPERSLALSLSVFLFFSPLLLTV